MLPERKQVLIVDDEVNLRKILSAQLTRDGYDVLTAEDGERGLQVLRERSRTEVPRLTEVLDWASGRVGLDVELKEDGYVPRVAEPLASFADGGGELLVTSFMDPVLAELGRFGAPVRCGLLIGFSATGAIARAQECGADAVVVQKGAVIAVDLPGGHHDKHASAEGAGDDDDDSPSKPPPPAPMPSTRRNTRNGPRCCC